MQKASVFVDVVGDQAGWESGRAWMDWMAGVPRLLFLIIGIGVVGLMTGRVAVGLAVLAVATVLAAGATIVTIRFYRQAFGHR